MADDRKMYPAINYKAMLDHNKKLNHLLKTEYLEKTSQPEQTRIKCKKKVSLKTVQEQTSSFPGHVKEDPHAVTQAAKGGRCEQCRSVRQYYRALVKEFNSLKEAESLKTTEDREELNDRDKRKFDKSRKTRHEANDKERIRDLEEELAGLHKQMVEELKARDVRYANMKYSLQLDIKELTAERNIYMSTAQSSSAERDQLKAQISAAELNANQKPRRSSEAVTNVQQSDSHELTNAEALVSDLVARLAAQKHNHEKENLEMQKREELRVRSLQEHVGELTVKLRESQAKLERLVQLQRNNEDSKLESHPISSQCIRLSSELEESKEVNDTINSQSLLESNKNLSDPPSLDRNDFKNQHTKFSSEPTLCHDQNYTLSSQLDYFEKTSQNFLSTIKNIEKEYLAKINICNKLIAERNDFESRCENLSSELELCQVLKDKHILKVEFYKKQYHKYCLKNKENHEQITKLSSEFDLLKKKYNLDLQIKELKENEVQGKPIVLELDHYKSICTSLTSERDFYISQYKIISKDFNDYKTKISQFLQQLNQSREEIITLFQP